MNIKPISSSSSECCYIVESGGYQLIIEAGNSLKRIREALNNDLSKVVGCLISHEHGDHARYVKQIEKETSIPIFCTEGTKERYELKNSFSFEELGFNCVPVSLPHDCECYGFIIPANQKILFYATDTHDVKYTIPGLTHLMIEANHSFELMLESERAKPQVKRAFETHLSIDKVVEFVKRHPDLEEIHLIHLSDAHSDAELFKKMVQDVAGCPVYVAGK